MKAARQFVRFLTAALERVRIYTPLFRPKSGAESPVARTETGPGKVTARVLGRPNGL
jgi:hypothetical protein